MVKPEELLQHQATPYLQLSIKIGVN